MTRTRGEARKEREAQEIRQNGRDQSSPLPPTLSRYPKRSSRKVAPQLFASPSLSRAPRPLLRPPQRVLKETAFASKPGELQTQHISEMEDVKLSPSTIFPTHSAPQSQHKMDLDGISQPPTENEAVSNDECVEEKMRQYLSPSTMTVLDGLLKCASNDEQDKMESIPMSHIVGILKKSLQDDMASANVEEGVSRRSRNDNVPMSRQDEMESSPVSHIEGILKKSIQDKMESAHVEQGISRKSDVPTSSVCLSNFTEFARGLKDDSNDDDDDDDDEVESAISPAYELVFTHKVKTEIAPLIRAMFDKYGDITSECNVKSSQIISFMLERLCDVYKNLEQRRLHDITNGEMEKMMDDLRFLEAHKVDISWLLDKLQQISETKIQFQKYLMAKDDEAECNACCEEIDKAIEAHRRQILLIEKKIAEGEISKAEKKAKAEECKQMALDIKRHLPSVKEVKNQSLVHGLL